MNIIEKLSEWWDRLDEDEQKTIKIIALACLIGVPLVIGLNILLIPYVYPALAALAVTIGILAGIGYAAALLLQFVAPIVLKYYNSEPSVESVTHAAPASGLLPDHQLTEAPEKAEDQSLTPKVEPAHEESQEEHTLES